MLTGHRQVTEPYLLALAKKKGGKLAPLVAYQKEGDDGLPGCQPAAPADLPLHRLHGPLGVDIPGEMVKAHRALEAFCAPLG